MQVKDSPVYCCSRDIMTSIILLSRKVIHLLIMGAELVGRLEQHSTTDYKIKTN